MLGRKKGRSTGKAKAIPSQQSDEGEDFDFNVSDSSSGNVPVATGLRNAPSGTSRPRAGPAAAVSEVVTPIAPTPRNAPSGTSRSRARAGPAAAVSEPTTVTPIAPTPPTVHTNADAAYLLAPIPTTGTNRSQAQDTNFLYFKQEIDFKGDMTLRNICKLCS